MTVIDIVREYLMANGYDGLYADDFGCGCLASELAPCGEIGSGCQAGYMVPCPPESDERECDGDCKWHIAAGKDGAK